MSGLAGIQTAIKSALSADSTLTGLLATSILDGTSSGVFNDVPDEQTYPFVQIGSATMRPWHTMGGPTTGIGWDDTVTVHVWSRYQGDLQALTIADRVIALLNFATISVTGFPTAIISVDDEHIPMRVLVEAVDKVETRHVPVVFCVKVHQ